MEQPKTPKRKARRKKTAEPTRARVNGTGRTVTVDDEAYLSLQTLPAKLKLTKSAYASAAIRYFADKNLDPTRQTAAEELQIISEKLLQLSGKVDTMQETARKQSADIGNRLVGIWRVLEKNLYTHLATEQNALLVYLQSIEANLLSKVGATETEYLWPMMERILRGATDSMMGRRMSSDILQLQADPTVPQYKRQAKNNEYSEAREAEVVRLSQEFLETTKRAVRNVTKRPALSVAPTTAIPAGKPKPPADAPPTTS